LGASEGFSMSLMTTFFCLLYKHQYTPYAKVGGYLRIPLAGLHSVVYRLLKSLPAFEYFDGLLGL
jgi:hypothetical protein